MPFHTLNLTLPDTPKPPQIHIPPWFFIPPQVKTKFLVKECPLSWNLHHHLANPIFSFPYIPTQICSFLIWRFTFFHLLSWNFLSPLPSLMKSLRSRLHPHFSKNFSNHRRAQIEGFRDSAPKWRPIYIHGKYYLVMSCKVGKTGSLLWYHIIQ